MRKLTITDVGPITETVSIEYKRFAYLLVHRAQEKVR